LTYEADFEELPHEAQIADMHILENTFNDFGEDDDNYDIHSEDDKDSLVDKHYVEDVVDINGTSRARSKKNSGEHVTNFRSVRVKGEEALANVSRDAGMYISIL
jgi:hypothetical protein